MNALLAGVACLLAAGAAAMEDAMVPELPPTDGHVDIAAQSWPRDPGPRTVRVYVAYPGGGLAAVTPDTGLMLVLHNWGGTHATGAPDPATAAARYNVVAISVDYLQSGTYGPGAGLPYDFGFYQALDALRALHWVMERLDAGGRAYDRARVYATGGSGGGNVSLMANKLAPRTFACVVDICGMSRLTHALAFGDPAATTLNAGWSPDPDSPRYLHPDAAAIRYVGHPEHAAAMKRLGNTCKVVSVHGVEDASCPVADKREMAANLQGADLDVEAHFITEDDLDGDAVTSAGHALGNRTEILHRFGGKYLAPGNASLLRRDGPSDFERGEAVRYETPGGAYVVDYAAGAPVTRFEPR